jgi:hypothetical protein
VRAGELAIAALGGENPERALDAADEVAGDPVDRERRSVRQQGSVERVGVIWVLGQPGRMRGHHERREEF